ncbi:MAG: OmpA family protein [Zoogloea sp.]|nr:OmpA family protein [Zoogloea sp.]
MQSSLFRLATLTLLVSGSLAAQAADTPVATKGEVGYNIDQRNIVTRSGFGLCWRTGYWAPSMAIAECDPDLLPKVVAEAPAATPAVLPAAPVVPAPAAPVVVPAAPRKCDFSVTLGADQSFAFNKAALTAGARARLDSEVVSRLATCGEVKAVIVTGHADRLGSPQYNQKLSEKRADAVAGYLESKGVNKDAVETFGAGKTQPAKSCDDKLGRKKLIECLAPNRRVVVDVKGSAK